MSECVWCRRELGRHEPATREHLIPRSRAGTSHKENIADACQDCNSRRHSKSLQAWRQHCLKNAMEPDVDLIIAKMEAYILRHKDVPKRARKEARNQLQALKGQASSL